MDITIGLGHSISCEDIGVVARREAGVSLSPSAKQVLEERREQIVSFIKETNTPVYGFNRGFGHNVDTPVSPDNLRRLQLNLIRSHSSGVGEPVSRELVRACMLLRAHSLAQGHSGVRPELVEQLLLFLNEDIIPLVPEFGSVGASGDIAPLSHIALSLIGEGRVLREDGSNEPTKTALERAGLTPIELQMKEGLALINGVQFSNAAGVLALLSVERQLKTACINAALVTQLMLGSDEPFRKDLQELRPHPGALKTSEWIRKLMQDSPIREVHRDCEVDGEVQDPYNLRCAPQVLGACHELIEEARTSFEIEANSATDNPLILPNAEGLYVDAISGGHFHGTPLATRLYGLFEALGIMSRLSNMRCARFVDEARNKGLGSDLIWPSASPDERETSSGMMIPEYATAALTNAVWGACMPSHLFSLSTDAGQEDYVSMSATLATRLLDTIPRLDEILAIELAYCVQAYAVRKELGGIPSKVHLTDKEEKKVVKAADAYKKAVSSALGKDYLAALDLQVWYAAEPEELRLSVLSEKVLELVEDSFPPLMKDRELSVQLSKLSELVGSGTLVEIAEL